MNSIKGIRVGIRTLGSGIALLLLLGVAPIAVAQSPNLPKLGRWSRLVDFLFNKDDPGRGNNGGSRGPNGPVCVVNPGAGETFWSQQPMFVLRGSVAEIALRPAGEPTALWTARFPLAPIQTVAVQYDGVPLTPGADYEWVLYQRQRDRSLKDVLTVPFRIMETGEERDRIATDLATFQTQGTAEGADADAGYFGFGAQVTYLFYSGLPADAFQALFSVSEPTAEFVASREALVTAICPPLDN